LPPRIEFSTHELFLSSRTLLQGKLRNLIIVALEFEGNKRNLVIIDAQKDADAMMVCVMPNISL
jgi:hypothetical protein